jgi:hypothetical protein
MGICLYNYMRGKQLNRTKWHIPLQQHCAVKHSTSACLPSSWPVPRTTTHSIEEAMLTTVTSWLATAWCPSALKVSDQQAPPVQQHWQCFYAHLLTCSSRNGAITRSYLSSMGGGSWLLTS